MRAKTKLYTVREIDGLRTVKEASRLYDYKAIEEIERHHPTVDAGALVATASVTGFASDDGIAVLASES